MLSPSTETRLEVATQKGEYDHWLTHEDIADIARIQYANYGTSDTADSYKAFEIIGSPSHLRNKLQTFIIKAEQIRYVRLSFIINIEQLHWVTLVIVSHDKNCTVFYLDSLKQELPANYQAILAENNLHLAAINLNGYFRGQEDDFNCGLWALENAQDMMLMTDEQKGLMWMSQRLQRPRSLNYFTRLRVLLSLKLKDDSIRKERVVPLEYQLPTVRQEIDTNSDLDVSKLKKQKLLTAAEKTRELFEFFVVKFVQDFVKRLGAHSLQAKGERLTAEALKAELKVGTTGALLGVAIFRGPGGSIPSLVGSLRNIGSKYYTNKKLSQKITNVFSELKPGDLSEFLTEAAVEIFQSYEQQFMQVTDKAGHKMAIEKLAEDAAGRALNYIDEKLIPSTPISSELIASGILSGKSETFFDPSLKKVRVRVTGSRIQDAAGNSFSTASLFERVGLIIKNKNPSLDTFYKKDEPQSTRYGYRRPLSWEKDSEGQLKEMYQASYVLENQAKLTTYEYHINPRNIQQEAQQILEKMGRASGVIPPSGERASPGNILFNLRRPIKNFSGRTLALTTLHQLLGSGTKSAVVTQKMAQLSLNPQQPLQEGIQTAVSGMGGIGKTQLVLEYAKQYAADYDHNVLWIEAEKKIDILDSFKKLARKLTIDLNDAYNNEKENSQLREEVYSYFRNQKSLFIFDNVENVKAIEDILPKLSIGNNPTVLITSRYSNWQNVATPFALDVFTEIESISFIQTELDLTNTEIPKIKELTKLLQNLPLALQQAIAYIKNEKNLDSEFTIQHYIERFKKKSQELVAFDFSNYSNDPYSKTVMTTWEITLEKLTQEKLIGTKAIETLQIMAYLYPDNISNQFFLTLKNNQYLSAAIQLLKNYSLINEGREPNISSIHRLVQKVLRINLEKNPSEFATIAQSIKFLTKDFVYDKEIMSHYYSFLLHMMQHEELTQALHLHATHKKILEVMVHYDGDKTLMFNLFESAQLTLARIQYLNLIGEALIIYMRCPFIVSLTHVIEYIEMNVNEGQLSLAEARQILDLQYTPLAAKIYKFGRFSPDPATSARQRNAASLVLMLDRRIFKDDATSCYRNKKRSANTLCSNTENEGLIQRPIEASKIKAYVKKIGRVANLANLGLLTKDTLSALIQADFESVAITFTLLSGSRILGKISNKLLTKGGELLVLGDEKLFQRELDYDAKLALSLFTDKEIMLAGKRRFFGSAMKAAAPFIARGSAVFFAYNFVKGLSNNETDWVDNLSNGAIVALDFGEAGIEAAEYLGYIAGVSEVTGPIGEGLGLLVIGGMQLRHVKQEMKAIEKWVHLSDREKFAEGMRAFFNFQPSEYLETKANNQQLVNKVIAFLKLHPEIQSYVFSTWLPATESAKNFVFLDRKRNMTLLSDTVPEEPREGHFFCLPGIPVRPHSTSWIKEHLESFVDSELLGIEERIAYLCLNTLGVEYNVNRTGNVTLIALQGEAKVIGLDSDSIILVNDGHHDYQAGNADDLFILQETNITGSLQGGLGINIVKFSEYQPAANESVLLDAKGFLCGKNLTTNTKEEFCIGGLQLSNITQLYGRKNQQDTIFSIAETVLIDAGEGESTTKPDSIYITEKSAKNLNITLRPDTVVRLLPRNITEDRAIIYSIPGDQNGTVSVQLPFNDQTIHQFHFESDLEDLNELNIKNNTISFLFKYLIGSFKLSIEATDAINSNASTNEKAFFIESSSYFFNNKKLGIKLLNEKALYTQWYSNNSIEEIIQYVAPIAHHIDKALVIQTLQNTTIAIGGREEEILSTDGLLVNHLVGNAGDAVYVIQTPKNLTDLFPLNDISLYSLVSDTLISSTTTDTLDLRELLKKVKDQCNTSTILLTINENNEDLTLSLYADYYFSASSCIPLAQNTYRIAKIILKNALINYWYQDLDIILDSYQYPMSIIFEEDKWKLARIPLVFMGNKNIIVITDEIIKQKDELFILKNIGQYRFMRHNDTDLLVTNLFNNVTEADIYAVLFSKFFKNTLFQEKILSLNLSFFDESLALNEHTQEINNARDFYGEIHSHFNTPHIVFNESGIFFNNATSPIKRRRRDIATPFSIASSSSSFTPDILNSFIYVPLKMLQHVRFMLNNFSIMNIFDINYQGEKGFATSKRNKNSILQPKKETSLPGYCNKNNFFTEEACVKNQTSLGLLGYCANTEQALVWFKKNKIEAAAVSPFSWFAIAYNSAAVNPHNNHTNVFNISLSIQTDHLYFSNKDGCNQVFNLNKMRNESLVTLFPHLPEEGKQWLLTEWSHEKNSHDQALQDEMAIGLFKQYSAQVGLNYIVNAGLLHTFAGDYFCVLGFRPNWQEHDPSHFLSRWLSAIQQLRLGGANQISTLAAALLETALLHSSMQKTFTFFLPNTKIRYKKQALRFCADLLQWGSLNFALMPSLLEMLFSDYLPIAPIAWGLRAVLSFYMINNDPSYYYLGIALFFLPQLPSLLEHLGIPVTAYISKTFEKLAQLFILPSLLGFRPTPDETRLAQRKFELQVAEQRVVKGITRMSSIVKPLNFLFKPVPSPCFDRPEDRLSPGCSAV